MSKSIWEALGEKLEPVRCDHCNETGDLYKYEGENLGRCCLEKYDYEEETSEMSLDERNKGETA